ncbi:hypothetical protein C8D99_1431 [Aminivibrio pyruvatiphilus]|uniref:Uncharacterized protein n=2 Tax=Aminivibrio pyruvatiphilus TaxID=1005740 RepID=A0A4V3HFA1_9BACT|nr:hypothetical protein C8D99_1431 [Aminivibrio pyruvatiphilus]
MRQPLHHMSLKRSAGYLCLAAGTLLLAWMAFEYFFLAFLAGKLLPDAGFSDWLAGFGRALLSLPGAAALFLGAAGYFLITKARNSEGRNDS